LLAFFIALHELLLFMPFTGLTLSEFEKKTVASFWAAPYPADDRKANVKLGGTINKIGYIA